MTVVGGGLAGCKAALALARTGHAAHGQLKREMRCLGSALLAAAEESRVPAGSSLAVDIGLFSAALAGLVDAHPGITVVREEAQSIPAGPAVVADPLP